MGFMGESLSWQYPDRNSHRLCSGVQVRKTAVLRSGCDEVVGVSGTQAGSPIWLGAVSDGFDRKKRKDNGASLSMKVHIPDAYAVEDLVLFGDMAKGVISKGFEVEVPDLSHAEMETLNGLEDDFRTFLTNIEESERLQIQFYKDGEYGRELERFQRVTDKAQASRLSIRQRTERYQRYRGRMEEDRLIQSNLRFYLSSKIEGGKYKGGRKREYYERIVKGYEQSFGTRIELGDRLLRGYGGKMRGLDRTEQLGELMRYFGPTLIKHYQASDLLEVTDPYANLMQLAQAGSPSPIQGPDHGFYLDGYYFGMVSLMTMPKQTFFGMMNLLTDLALPNYRVVVNGRKLSVEREIQQTESDEEKLVNASMSKAGRAPKLRVFEGRKHNARRVERLMGNEVTPWEAQWVVMTWDQSLDGLRSKMATLKGTIGKLRGIKYYEPSWEIASLNYFAAAIPGWSFGRYKDFTHKIDDVNLVDLLPLGGTPKADLAEAEILMDGAAGNLIGLRTFGGSLGSETPLLSLMTGSKGSGKSLMVNDFLIQSEPYYDYTVIIDNGMGYGVYTSCVDRSVSPIVIRSNGAHTINPFDTRGLPLSGELLANAVALMSLLIGGSDSPDKRRYRESLMAMRIKEVYADYSLRYAREHEEQMVAIARQTMGVERWLRERSSEGEGFIDAYSALVDLQSQDPEAFQEWCAPESEVMQYLENPRHAESIRNMTFAHFLPEEFPTLSEVQDEMASRGRSRLGGIETQECAIIATLLETWLRDGPYGPMVDGVSNIRLDRKIVHFELGKIKESERDLLNVAGFLIMNDVRNYIMTLPRSLRKRQVLEEMSALLSLDNGPKICRDLYERMRKYNCWVLSILQNIARVHEQSPGVASAILSNTDQLFLLKSNSRADLDLVSKTYPIPEVTKDTVMRFASPSGGGAEVYAGFALVQLQEGQPKVTIGRNYAHDEMLYVASSTGSVFEQRSKELRGAKDMVDAIIQYSQRQPDAEDSVGTVERKRE
jgi:hypothetical protein